MKNNLYVNNTKVLNPNFKGFNMVHQLFYDMPDQFGRVYTEEMIETEVDALKRMRVRHIRSFYGGSLSWDHERKVHDFENEHMQAFYKSCKRMADIGVEIGITPQWAFHGFLKDVPEESKKPCVSLGYNGCYDEDFETTAKNFETFIEESVLAFERHGVDNIKYFYCFTECNNTFTGLAGKPAPGEKKKPQCERREYERLMPLFGRMIKAIDQGLKNAGMRDKYKIVAPCDNWRADDGSEPYSILVKYCLEHLSDEVDIIGSHNGYDRNAAYTDDRYYKLPFIKVPDPMERAHDAGKGFWIDEMNVAVHEYTSLAKRYSNANPYKGLAFGAMVNAVMNLEKVDHVLVWAFADQQWPDYTNNGGFDNGVLVCGYYPNLLERREPFPSWYAVSLVTRYLGEGTTYQCRVGDSVYLSAIQRTDGEWTVVVTNYTNHWQDIRLNFEASMGGKTFYRYLYNPATVLPMPSNEMIGSDAAFEDVELDLIDQLPPMCMAVYTTEKPE